MKRSGLLKDKAPLLYNISDQFTGGWRKDQVCDNECNEKEVQFIISERLQFHSELLRIYVLLFFPLKQQVLSTN
jgi:hypothetical protein